MIHRNREADQGHHMLMKIVSLSEIDKENRRIKVCEVAEVAGIAKTPFIKPSQI
jgi:hypothetical protein